MVWFKDFAPHEIVECFPVVFVEDKAAPAR